MGFWETFQFAGMDFGTLTMVMLFYSVIGWLYESTVFSLGEQGQLMDRGMFIGPICPIYAVVSVLCLQLFHNVHSAWQILLLSGLSTCVVEYFTSVVFERLFHKRYWDYSYYPLNIDGRVSVLSGLFFGIALLAMMRIIHPWTLRMVALVSPLIRFQLARAIWAVFFVDAFATAVGNLTQGNRFKRIYDDVILWKQQQFERMNGRCSRMEDYRIVRAGRLVVNKGKAINRKAVDMENHWKAQHPRGWWRGQDADASGDAWVDDWEDDWNHWES